MGYFWFQFCLVNIHIYNVTVLSMPWMTSLIFPTAIQGCCKDYWKTALSTRKTLYKCHYNELGEVCQNSNLPVANAVFKYGMATYLLIFSFSYLYGRSLSPACLSLLLLSQSIFSDQRLKKITQYYQLASLYLVHCSTFKTSI